MAFPRISIKYVSNPLNLDVFYSHESGIFYGDKFFLWTVGVADMNFNDYWQRKVNTSVGRG